MNKKIQLTFFIIGWSISLATFSYITNTASTVNAETSVANSINVTANSNSAESSASVITIVNGEVIEDWSATSTDPIRYSSTYNNDTESISMPPHTNADTSLSQTSSRDQLKAMIAHLEALISLYVLLLHN